MMELRGGKSFARFARADDAFNAPESGSLVR